MAKRNRAVHKESEQKLEAPGLLLMALEGRAPFELWAAIMAAPILRNIPSGDGHPVLVFPGLAAGDMTTALMRKFLDSWGYATYAWEQGINLGPRPGIVEGCIERVQEIRAKHGRPVSLIGWSLGGVYAREISKLTPHDVRSVVTLGTPFTGHPKATNAWRVYELTSGHRLVDDKQLEALKETPPVPTTSIFSRTDGIVAWQCSIEEETATSENIEVHASHFGIGVNPTALYAIADRLAQPEGKWKRFDRDGHSGVKKLLYLDPQRKPWLGIF
ncbi:MAG TPA: alpha/beta hydrolase [Burkholderiaceae bacterium]|jgi:pimeloyl-ACP methyl ester carboxylesterase|nr:alpha/beta hydrolase [Burkholderiaceae bacterium]